MNQTGVLFFGTPGIYINDITDGLETMPFVYADDTTLIEVVDDLVVSAEKLNNDLVKISEWSD